MFTNRSKIPSPALCPLLSYVLLPRRCGWQQQIKANESTSIKSKTPFLISLNYISYTHTLFKSPINFSRGTVLLNRTTNTKWFLSIASQLPETHQGYVNILPRFDWKHRLQLYFSFFRIIRFDPPQSIRYPMHMGIHSDSLPLFPLRHLQINHRYLHPHSWIF